MTEETTMNSKIAGRAALVDGYYWYQDRHGSAPILVMVDGEHVLSGELSCEFLLPSGQDDEPHSMVAYGTYAGPVLIATPESCEASGLPVYDLARPAKSGRSGP